MKKKLISAKTIIPIQYWESQQGAKVYLVKRSEIPAVNIDIFFKAGSAFDHQQHGLSSIANAMLNQGTTSYDADEIANRFADVGAQLRIYSGRDSACLGLKCLSEKKYFNSAFKTFLNILSSINFPEDAFQRRQKQTLSVLQMHQQTPNSIAKDAFYSALYGEHPYAYPVEGTQKSIMSLTREDAERFYRKYYVIRNATIIIVGDISRQDAEKKVDEIAKSLPQGEEAPAIVRAMALRNHQEIRIPFPSEQSNVWLGQLGMTIHDPDYYAMQIANDILGGASITSRLFTQIRGKHGLVYGIGSTFQYSDGIGPFLIHFATQNSTVKKALSLTQSIVRDYVNKGPSQKEFMMAKQKINNEFPLSIATNQDILHYLIQIGFYKLPVDYIDTYRANIAAVSLAEVKAALKKHIKPDEMIKVIVGE